MLRTGFLCAILALACGPTAARAGFNASIIPSVTSLGNGQYFYNYTLVDLTSSTVAISEFDVAVNDPFGITSISSPSDFYTFYNAGDTTLTFYASDAGINPGSGANFSFISSSAPGMVAEVIRGLDPSYNVDNAFGIVPGAIPEPSSLLMCLLGALGPVGLVVRSRWRRTA